MLRFLSKLIPNGNPPGRIPVLSVAIGIGLLLVTGGVAMRVQQDQAVAVAYAGTTTALAPTLTPSVTPTETLTPTPSDTPTPTDTPTRTPTGTLTPSATPTDTQTPSPTPVPAGTVRIQTSTPDPNSTLVVPTPVAPVGVPDDVENILLLGSDRRPELHEINLTDTIIVVSINRKEGTVNMLSIPRDLYVYAPGWDMVKINTVYGHGEGVGWPGGGPGLLKETLLYNFGITIHHYSLVDLGGFRKIVDTIGGIDVPVSCNYTGYRLIPPAKNPDDFPSYEDWVNYTDPESGNWEVYTLPVGVHHFDGYEALWYARFRKGSSDFDRAVRQQQVLRAMLVQARSQGLLNVVRIPELWNQYNDLVKTDMGLGNMLDYLPIATDIQPDMIASYNITDLIVAFTPQTGNFAGLDGFVLNPDNPDGIAQRIQVAMGPPAQTVLQLQSPVEIRNATDHKGLDQIAADQLASRFSMNAIPTGPSAEGYIEKTTIYDYTGKQKSTQLIQIQRTLKVADANVVVQPDPNRTVDYVVVLGEDYYNQLQQCLRQDPETKNAGTGTPGVTPTP